MNQQTTPPPSKWGTIAAVLAIILIVVAVLVMMVTLTPEAPAATRTAPTTYGEYSMMTQRHAGQVWAGGQPATQWAWTPGPGPDSQIRWGNPATWPPPSYEQFTRDGDWVLLTGYGDSTGLVAPQTVWREEIGDVNCRNMTPIPPDPQHRQHYVRWTIPTQAYCLHAWGRITYQGVPVDFFHEQVWFPPSKVGTCSNAYRSGQTCIKQHERWFDNQGNLGGLLTEVHRRDNILAAGIGPGWILHDYRTGWHADLKYDWAY